MRDSANYTTAYASHATLPGIIYVNTNDDKSWYVSDQVSNNDSDIHSGFNV